MANTVKLTQTIDDREVVNALHSQLKLIDKIAAKLDKVGKSGRRGGRDTAQGFAGAAREVGKFIGAITGVGTVLGAAQLAVSQIRKEVEMIRSRQKDAGDTQVNVARAQREALLNLGPERAGKLNEVIDQIADETGAQRLDLFKTASVALSFKGRDLEDEDAFDAVRQAARLNPFDAEEQTSIAQGILAQKKKTGGTAEEVAGFQLAVKRASPVAASKEFSDNIAPGIADQIQFGSSAREAGALLATLGQGIGDPTGRITRNAAINFTKQLAQLAPEEQGTLARLEAIRNDPERRSHLLGVFDEQMQREAAAASGDDSADPTGALTGEAKAFATMVALLQQQDNDTQRLLRKTLQDIPELSQGDELFNRELALVDAETLQQTARLADVAKSAAEGIRLSDTGGGRAGISRQALDDLLKASGVGATRSDLLKLAFEAQGGLSESQPIGAVVDLLRGESDRLRNPGIDHEATAISGTAVQIPVSDRDRKTAEALDQAAQRLESALGATAERLERNTAATEANTRETGRQTNTPAHTAPPTAGLSRQGRP